MNPFDGILNTTLKNQFKDAINEIIRAFKVPCRLYYPVTKYTACTNCNDPVYSNSPNPFIAGNKGRLTTSCPECGGDGQIPVETYEDLDLPVIFNYKNMNQIVPNIVFAPKGDAQTFSHISTISAIKGCKYAIFDTNIEHSNQHTFIRDSEPVPMGFGSDDYILTTWKVGG